MFEEPSISCRVLSKCRPLPPSPVPGPAWAQTAAGGAGGAGKGSWRGAGAAVHPGERHFMVRLLGMTSPQRPSHRDGSDTLSSAASSPSRLILLGSRIPSTGTSVGPNPTHLSAGKDLRGHAAQLLCLQRRELRERRPELCGEGFAGAHAPPGATHSTGSRSLPNWRRGTVSSPTSPGG